MSLSLYIYLYRCILTYIYIHIYIYIYERYLRNYRWSDINVLLWQEYPPPRHNTHTCTETTNKTNPNPNKHADEKQKMLAKTKDRLVCIIYNMVLPIDSLLTAYQDLHLKDCPFHRIVPNYVIHGGDIVKGGAACLSSSAPQHRAGSLKGVPLHGYIHVHVYMQMI